VEHETNSNQNAKAELHLLYEFPNGKPVVLAVMIEEGLSNPALAALLADPPAACQSKEPPIPINLAQLIPGELNRYLTYIGSLTTPPCTEGVWWIILDQAIRASREQIAQLSNGQNNRPLQQWWAHQIRWRQAPQTP
jgi:carbonic anhydrase